MSLFGDQLPRPQMASDNVQQQRHTTVDTRHAEYHTIVAQGVPVVLNSLLKNRRARPVASDEQLGSIIAAITKAGSAVR